MITTAIAMIASSQLSVQLSIADLESVRPMAMMIGPVTIGGKTTEITRNYQMSDLLLTVRKGDTISITVLRNAFGGGQTEVTETVTFDKDEYFKIYG